ncbi:RNA-binding protein 33 isoform X1 [Gadus macrocephalus]|uniref:RNA-binding protein 33 isoform X1 n=1 Tax=Gadus macrocephalus TaxID=80720 RepID=UPI0028CB197B|nr:RNA-binding protein 33 isoform X1 [Gadus macrocephalus]
MAANGQGEDLQYQKPGAERSRRRRGEDDDLDSDLEEDLLEEDWLSAKKNASEASDEELNDDLLQSDDEDIPHLSAQQVSLNATFSLGTTYSQQGQGDYADDVVDLGGKVFQEGAAEGEYVDEFSQGDQAHYGEEMNDGLQGEVLDLQITEPLDGEFQDEDEDYPAAYQQMGSPGGAGAQYHQGSPQEEGLQEPEEEERGAGEQESQEEEDLADSSHLLDQEEGENEMGEDTKEESDEEDEDDEGSGRLRFKSERKDATVVRVADAASKRRNIPETLELSEKAKADLMEFEMQDRQRREGRFGGGWGRGGGRGYGRGNPQGFGGQNFRGRGRMNDQRNPLMGHMGMQHSARLPGPMRPHPHHTQGGSRGQMSFQEHRGGPLGHSPSLQPLMPPHLAHRSPPPQRPQLDSLQQRLLVSPPPNFPQNAPPQPPPGPAPQSKNIHINPHFRGPASTPPAQQAPLTPSVQMQPRPGGAPQRFPGPGDFQQTGPFGQPQRPPPFLEPFRSPVAPPPQEREPFFIGEPRFPGQPMFDQQMTNILLGAGGPQPPHRLPQEQQPPPQGHVTFGQPAPVFNQTGPGPLGLFQREPPRAGIPPQGLGGLNQHGGPPNQPRPFMGPRQPFGQQQNQNLFTPPPFGMQGVLQLPHHDHMASHPPQHHQSQHHQSQHHHQQQQQQQQHHQQQQQHRQDLPPHHHHHPQHHHQQQQQHNHQQQQQHQQQQHHHQQQQQHHQQQQQQQQQHQLALSDHRPMIHQGQNPFQGGPRQMTPRHQNPPPRNGPPRQHMNAPTGKQHMQILPQRNSNLRELPVAPGNNNNITTTTTAGNFNRPGAVPGSNIRPVARATPGPRPAAAVGLGRGRPPVGLATGGDPPSTGRTVVRKEVPQDPEEDEETRQYRMKIEEQKCLREQILRRKEIRRQMQAGVRKKELLDRLNAQSPAQLPGPNPDQAPGPSQGVIQGQYQGPPQQQMAPPQAQRQFPFKQQQQQVPPNQGPVFPPHQGPGFPPNPGQGFPPNGVLQVPQLRTPVRPRLQPGMGIAGPSPQRQIQQQQAPPPQQTPQRRNSAQSFQQPQPPQRIMPIQGVSSVGPSPLQSLAMGPKVGVKRTVMQRSRSLAEDDQQLPEKVRIVKLPGAHGRGTEPQGIPEPLTIPSLTQGAHRKVMHAGAMAMQPGRGGGANRVLVAGRGRARWAPGRGRAAQGQQVAESQACTVSIEGLSSSTTDAQLRNLLHSIGPIQMFKMLPHQRKALAKFSNPDHASSFQKSFNRHMIDLSHIDVSLVDG